ncbi:hypothetical protein OH76DRAFT_1486647 [Lentinus brumalis]|uniref:Uncharacterized protein n=1 Tax=Lentinus brumalis TaxID=2498619 RepID=A0A371CXM4_9APHY|nr:hypothetical protein OH76DRAFT_1486647 [Polyporus brumalis]
MSNDELLSADFAVLLHARAPINHIVQLPPELLIIIFLYVVFGDDRIRVGEYTIPSFEDARRARLVLTHVCRGWRDLAAATPSLWSAIHNDEEALYEEDISRAKTASMTLRLLGSRDGAETVLERISRQLRRIDVVYMQEPTLAALRRLEMPLLECLTAIARRYTSVRLWDQLLGANVVGLQGLALGEVVGLPTNQFPNLTHLYLAPPFSQTPPVSTILKMLANTPALQYLHQVHVQTRHADLEPGTGVRSYGTVLLRSMRGLVLETHLDHALTLLEHLAMPKNRLIRIAANMDVLPAGDRRLDRLLSRRVTTLQLATRPHSLNFVTHASDRAEELPMWFSVTWREPLEPWPTGIVHTIILSALECLSVATRDSGLFPYILPHLPCLVDLRVIISSKYVDRTEESKQVSEALHTALGQSSPLVCRRLRSLALLARERIPAVFSPIALIKMATARAQLGCRLSRIVVQWRADPGSEEPRQLFADTFNAALAEHVDELVLVADGEPGSLDSGGELRSEWAMADAEKYWILPRDFTEQHAPHRLW